MSEYKKKKYRELRQQGGLVVGGICYVRPLYDEVLLCIYSLTSGI